MKSLYKRQPSSSGMVKSFVANVLILNYTRDQALGKHVKAFNDTESAKKYEYKSSRDYSVYIGDMKRKGENYSSSAIKERFGKRTALSYKDFENGVPKDSAAQSSAGGEVQTLLAADDELGNIQMMKMSRVVTCYGPTISIADGMSTSNTTTIGKMVNATGRRYGGRDIRDVVHVANCAVLKHHYIKHPQPLEYDSSPSLFHRSRAQEILAYNALLASNERLDNLHGVFLIVDGDRGALEEVRYHHHIGRHAAQLELVVECLATLGSMPDMVAKPVVIYLQGHAENCMAAFEASTLFKLQLRDRGVVLPFKWTTSPLHIEKPTFQQGLEFAYPMFVLKEMRAQSTEQSSDETKELQPDVVRTLVSLSHATQHRLSSLRMMAAYVLRSAFKSRLDKPGVVVTPEVATERTATTSESTAATHGTFAWETYDSTGCTKLSSRRSTRLPNTHSEGAEEVSNGTDVVDWLHDGTDLFDDEAVVDEWNTPGFTANVDAPCGGSRTYVTYVERDDTSAAPAWSAASRRTMIREAVSAVANRTMILHPHWDSGSESESDGSSSEFADEMETAVEKLSPPSTYQVEGGFSASTRKTLLNQMLADLGSDSDSEEGTIHGGGASTTVTNPFSVALSAAAVAGAGTLASNSVRLAGSMATSRDDDMATDVLSVRIARQQAGLSHSVVAAIRQRHCRLYDSLHLERQRAEREQDEALDRLVESVAALQYGGGSLHKSYGTIVRA